MDFFLGYCSFEIHLPGSHSLKDKRSEVKGLLSKVRQKFNVAAAEVSHQEQWQLAGLAVAAVSNEKKHVEDTLEKVLRFVEQQTTGEVVSRVYEIL